MSENVKKENDLGKDPIGKLLLKLAIPAILAQIINALYNIVDRIFIGRIEGYGDLALTGVGVTFPILMIISAFSSLIGMGGSPRVAIKLGEGEKDEAENILGNCFVTLIGISVVLTILLSIFGRDLLMLFGASNDTIEYANSYLSIYVCGTIFVQLSVGLNSFISTQGKAKIAMRTVLIGAITNILLDPIFIFALDLGVQGAAYATVISQSISAIWVTTFLFSKKSSISIKRKYFKLKKSIILPVLALGIAPFIMQSTESLLNIALNSSLQKYGGDIAVGSMTIITSVMQFCLMPLMGLSQSAQPIIGFNFGANQMDRVIKTFKYLLLSAITYACIVWGLTMTLPEFFVRLFTNEEALVENTVWGMRIFLSAVFLLGPQFSCQQTFVALGEAKISLLLALLRKVFILIPLIYILPMFFENKVFAIFVAEPIADVLATATTCIVFTFKFKKILNEKSQLIKEKD